MSGYQATKSPHDRRLRRQRVGLVLASLALLTCAVLLGTAGVVRGDEPAPSPSPSPSGPPPVTTVVGADDLWHAQPVTLHLVAEDRGGTGIAATEYAIDAGAWVSGTTVKIPAPTNHSWDGIHVISFRSRDNAGVIEETQTCRVRIDTAAPACTWVSCLPVLRVRTGPEWATVRLKDVSGRSTVRLEVRDALNRRIALTASRTLANGTHKLRWNGRTRWGHVAPPGSYNIRLVMADSAGNSRFSGVRRIRDQHPVKARVVRSNRSAGRRVALTFDDGGSSAAWAGILTVLRRYGVKGTFFPTGGATSSRAALARRTIAEGHDIGDHSWSHPAMSRLSYAAQLSQLRSTQNLWWRLTKRTTAPFFRPPYGDYSSTTVAAAGAAGYKYVVLWDVDPFDWRQPGAGVITSRVLGSARAGSIILLHTTGQTVQALPGILRGLKARGLRPVRLHELFAAGLR